MCKCPRRYKNKGTGGARTKDQRRSRSPARPTTNDSVTIAGPLEDEDFVLNPGLVTEEENDSAFQPSQDGSPHEADQEARSAQDEPTTEDLLRRSKRRRRPQVSFSERREKLGRSSSPILGSRRVRRKCRKSCSLTGSRNEANKFFTPESPGLPAVSSSSSSKNIPHAQPRHQACMPFPASAPFHHYDSAAAAQDCWIIPNIPVTFSTLPFLTKKKVDHREPKIAPGEAPSNSLLSEVSSSSSYMEDFFKPAVVALPPSNNTKGSTNKSSNQEEPRGNTSGAADLISSNYSKWYCSATSLGPNFCPGPHDVICARGKRTYNHPGNERFRSLVQDAYPQYKNAKSKSERSSIVSGIVNQVRRFIVAPPADAPAKQDAKDKPPVLLGGFVKREADGNWIEVGETLAREKISQMMRNFVGGSEYSSSIEHKRQRKHARKANLQRLERLHQVVLSNPKVKAAVIELTNHVAHHQQQPNQNEQASSMALFHSLTQDMLSAIKADSEMLTRFLQTEQDLRLEEQQHYPLKKPRRRASSDDHDKEE